MIRAILHVDMDAFYASVEQRDHPEWIGLPVVVGGDPAAGHGRGVVAACSYEARAFGIHSALPIGRAWRLCPDAIFVRPRMRRYSDVSRLLFALLHDYTDLVEPLSIDEAFLDVTGSRRVRGDAESIGCEIKERVRRETGLVASVGVAPNKFLAKIASDLDKPDGFVVVRPGEERAFLAPLPLGRLWGVGPKTEARLRGMGLRTIGDVARLRAEDVAAALGEHGGDLIALARGEDHRPVEPASEPKSLGAETTFDRDTGDPERVRRTLLGLAERVASRLRGEGLRAGGVTLKHRDEEFHTSTRSQVFTRPTDLTEDLYAGVLALLERVPDRSRRVRLLGVTATHLCEARAGGAAQLDLFAPPGRGPRLSQVAGAVDEIRRQFGARAITRAALLDEGDARRDGEAAGKKPP